jgi:predicted metal-dependent hydrolase
VTLARSGADPKEKPKTHDSLVHDGEVIEYTVVRSGRRRKTLSLTLDKDGRVVVAVPLRASKAQIQDFVTRSGPWVIRKRAALAVTPPPPRLESGASMLLLGEPVLVDIVEVDGTLALAKLEGGRFRVTMPGMVMNEAREQTLRLLLSRWYRRYATIRLTQDTRRWAEVMQVEPMNVRVRDQRRRWGSCSSKGNINFNFRLVMMPPDIIDYVVVHELAHMRVPNHSRAFWDEVARFVPDYAERRARLNQLGPTLAI